MITLSPEEAALALGVEGVAEAVTGVSTDTRTLEPGDLFVALRGDNYNGNQFVPAAFAGGAAAAVVEIGAVIAGDAAYAPPGGGLLYRVADTRVALGALARAARRASSATIVAVTGSVGKTSTKDLVRAMAGAVGSVVATAANQNNEIGVPLTLLEIVEDTDLAVVEMGMRGKGQIRELTLIAEPDVAVITAIAPVHLELVGTLEDVVAAKVEIFEGLRAGGAAVVPVDAAAVITAAERSGARVVRFSFEDARRGAGDAECFAAEAEADRAEVRGVAMPGADGPILRLEWPGGGAEIAAPFRAAHRLRNATAAAAACFAAGLDVQACVAGLADVSFTPLRGDEALVGGVLLVDDTYNASPVAVRLALEDLAATATGAGMRPVAVLGDMLELGPDAVRYHREAGVRAARVGIRSLWGIGPRSQATVEAFSDEARAEIEAVARRGNGGAAVQPTLTAVWVERPEQAIDGLVGYLRPGDVVLVKGSRGMKLDRLVEELGRRLDGGPEIAGDTRS
ncbi:MAG: UDP-N-acetylmuramoyl-tripeptide--D-alanyl-D-alanine ligase [Thermoleophilia bacterium]